MISYARRIRLHVLSALMAALIGAASALLGAITQMMTDGKTNLSDISDLVWLVTAISALLAFSKDIQAYLKGHDQGGS